jgi:argininosuccinate lyase
MSENKKTQTDTETILMALDQVSQTIDVMTSVVGRLRTFVQEQGATVQAENAEKTAQQSDQTVH